MSIARELEPEMGLKQAAAAPGSVLPNFLRFDPPNWKEKDEIQDLKRKEKELKKQSWQAGGQANWFLTEQVFGIGSFFFLSSFFLSLSPGAAASPFDCGNFFMTDFCKVGFTFFASALVLQGRKGSNGCVRNIKKKRGNPK